MIFLGRTLDLANVRLWHIADVNADVQHVCFRGRTSLIRSSASDPKRTSSLGQNALSGPPLFTVIASAEILCTPWRRFRPAPRNAARCNYGTIISCHRRGKMRLWERLQLLFGFSRPTQTGPAKPDSPKPTSKKRAVKPDRPTATSKKRAVKPDRPTATSKKKSLSQIGPKRREPVSQSDLTRPRWSRYQLH